MQNARKYNYFSNFYKVNFVTLKNIKKRILLYGSHRFPSKCTPFVLISLKGVRGETKSRTVEKYYRAATKEVYVIRTNVQDNICLK